MFYPTDTHATITLECDAAAAGPDGLAGFVREVSSTFGADFGYVDVLPGADGPESRRPASGAVKPFPNWRGPEAHGPTP